MNSTSNVSLEKLINALGSIDILVKHQVVNYQNKVIGVTVDTPETAGSIFVPCFPSAVNMSIPYIYMDDSSLEWNTYTNTVATLKKIAISSNGSILFTTGY